MRLFIGFDIPEEVDKILNEIQEAIKPKSRKAHFHCTLKFLGEVGEERLDAIKEKLSEVKFSPYKVRLGDIGFFPDEKGARIIWIGLEPIYDTIELQRRIDKMLAHWFE